MMKQLGMDNNKECINILKNFGICAMKKGNYHEAIEYLERAHHVTERELEADHMWKVMIKTELALCYERKEELIEDAKMLMKEGIKMRYRLQGQKVYKLGNKRHVWEFLDRHKEDFPTTEFPR